MLNDDPAIGGASKLAVQGHFLWVSDPTGDPYLHIIDLSDGLAVKSFGRRGAGPGDFSWIAQLSKRPGDTSGIWVYDGNLRRLTEVVPGPRPVPQRTIPGLARIPGGGTVALQMLWLTRDTILFIGFSDTNRIMFADSTGHVFAVRRGPLLGAPVVPKAIREESSGGTILCPSPSGDHH